MGKKLNIVKGIAGFAANVGGGMIVGAAVSVVAPTHALRLIPKVLIMTGMSGIALGVGDFAEKNVTKYIDQVAELTGTVQKGVNDVVQEAKKAAEANTNEGQ